MFDESKGLRDFMTSDWNWRELHLRLSASTLLQVLPNIGAQDGRTWMSLKRFAVDVFMDLGDEDLFPIAQALPALEHRILSFPFSVDDWGDVDAEDVPTPRVPHASLPELTLKNSGVCIPNWIPTLLDYQHFPALRRHALDEIIFFGEAAETFSSAPLIVLPLESLVIKGSETAFVLNSHVPKQAGSTPYDRCIDQLH